MSKTIELPDGTPHTFTDAELERGEAMMACLREVEASLVGDTGQTTYSEMLLPCPFCGGEAVFHEYTGRSVEVALANRCDVPATIKCERCGAMVSFNTGTRSTRRDAADAWNRRAERTCHYVYDKEICAWRCSECGGLEPVGDHVHYCPDCGAKILGE